MDKHLSLVTLIICTAILTGETISLISFDGSFNAIDLLLVIFSSIMAAKTYTHLTNGLQ